MSKISIDLDLAVVQKALHAKVQPAVDKILSGYDLSAMIVKQLEVKAAAPDTRYGVMYAMMLGERVGSGLPLIEGLIKSSIAEAAEKFVKAHVEAQKPEIEASFKKMLAGSSDKLARTFLASLDSALKDEWSFTLSTKVAPKEHDCPSDY